MFCSFIYGQTPTENYVYSATYKEAHTSSLNVSDEDKLQEITYYDGLGRPKLVVKKRSGGQGQDIVLPIVYDGYGRQSKEYLPYANPQEDETNATLSYRDPQVVISDIESYYASEYPLDIDGASPNPYTEKILENSPLNRVLEQGAPGSAWAADPDSDSDHTIKFGYQTNTSNEVRYFRVNFPDATDTETPSLHYGGGHYATGELYKSITKDENWQPGSGSNHTTEEFTNKLGQVVLKRTYADSLAHDTHYVYDDYGNLTYVLSPEASSKIISGGNLVTNSQQIIDGFDIDLVQLPFNILDKRLKDSGILNNIIAQGIEVHARSVFLQGLLLMSEHNRPKQFDHWSNLWKLWHEWLAENQITALEASIRHVISISEISKVLVGVHSTDQLRDIVKAADGNLPTIPEDLFTFDNDLLNPSNWNNL